MQPLSDHYLNNVLQPQITKLAAARLDAAAAAAGVELNGTRDTLVEAVTNVLVNGDEIEPVSEAGRVAVSVVADILSEARVNTSGDVVLDLLLYHRFLYGEEPDVPGRVFGTVHFLTKSRPKRRGGVKRTAGSLKRAGLK